MAKEKGEKIRVIYGICLAVLSILVGVLFIIQTWRIYTAAEQSPYTPERISQMFKQISVPVFLWLAAVVAGEIVFECFPEEKKRPKVYVDLRASLKRAEKRLPSSLEYLSAINEVKSKEEGFRKWVVVAATVFAFGVLFVCFSVLFDLFYFPLVKSAFFTAHDGLVGRLFQIALLLVIAFTLIGFCGGWLENSRKRQQKRYVEILSSAKGKPKAETTVVTEGVKRASWREKVNFWDKLSKETQKKTMLGVRIALGVVGVVFIVWGIANGGMKDVLLKAINICTQCIGLG